MSRTDDSKPFGRYDEWLRLFVAFVLTGVIGATISVYFQDRAWRHQRALTLCDDDKKSATDFANRLSDAMDRRLWALRRFVERLSEKPDLTAAAEERKAYREAVADWNMTLNKNRILIRRYFGQAASDDFISSVHHDGFGKLHDALNGIVLSAKIDPNAVLTEKEAIDAFNPTVYFFDDKLLDMIQKEATAGCVAAK